SVASIVSEKLGGLPQLTTEEVKQVAEEVIAGVAPLSGPDAELMIEAKLGGIQQLSEEDVKRIAGEATSGMETLSPESVASIVSEKLGGLPQITEEEVRRIVNEIVSGQTTVTPEEVSLLAVEAIGSMGFVDEDKVKEILHSSTPAQEAGADVDTIRGEIKNAVTSLLGSEVFKEAVNKNISLEEALDPVIDQKLESMQRVMTASQPSQESGPSQDDIELLIESKIGEIKAMIGDGALEPAESVVVPFGADEEDGGGMVPAQITNIVRLEVEKKVQAMVPQGGGGGGDMSPEVLKEHVKEMLPDLLSVDEVQSIIIASVAMHAVAEPGILGEMTGLKAYLQDQIQKSIQEMM
ncbi:hypothetical protein ACFL6F_02365, partial [Planctomycetota bacterium]